MLDERFAYLTIVINLSGSLSYFVATIKGFAQPNRVTFSMWTLIPLLAFAAELSEGVGHQAVMTLAAGIGPGSILAASFIARRSQWVITTFDAGCGMVSLAALAMWITTGRGVTAIVLAIAADMLATIPTVTKAYRFPETENVWSYWCSTAAGMLTLATIDSWDVPHVGFPAYVVASCGLIAVLIATEAGVRHQRRA